MIRVLACPAQPCKRAWFVRTSAQPQVIEYAVRHLRSSTGLTEGAALDALLTTDPALLEGRSER